jgi:hypothetical protein
MTATVVTTQTYMAMLNIARGAGGVTLSEWRRKFGDGDINAKRYLDPETDLWIPKNILLWRQRPLAAAIKQMEDDVKGIK